MKIPNYLKRAHKESTKAGWTWEDNTNHITIRNQHGTFVIAISTTQYDGSLRRKTLGKLRQFGCPGI